MKIKKEQTISEVLKNFPETVPVFQEFGMHCLGCPTATGEPIEQAAMVHGIEVEKLLKALNEKVN